MTLNEEPALQAPHSDRSSMMHDITITPLCWYDGPQIFSFEFEDRTFLGFLSAIEDQRRLRMFAFEMNSDEIRSLLRGQIMIEDVCALHGGTVYYNDPDVPSLRGERFTAISADDMPEDDRSILSLSGTDITNLIGHTDFCGKHLETA